MMTTAPVDNAFMSPPIKPERACSKCEGLLDTSGYPLWCRKCRAGNKREYEATKKEMQESRGYAAGISAMREYLAAKFREYGTQGSFTGIEVAHYITQSQGPNAVR